MSSGYISLCVNGKAKHAKGYRLRLKVEGETIYEEEEEGDDIELIAGVQTEGKGGESGVVSPTGGIGKRLKTSIPEAPVSSSYMTSSLSPTAAQSRKQKPVVQLDGLNGKVLREFASQGEAANALGIDQSDVSRCLNGHTPDAAGYFLALKSPPSSSSSSAQAPRAYKTNPVLQLDGPNGKVLCEFNSQTDAAAALKLSTYTVSMCVNGHTSNASGYFLALKNLIDVDAESVVGCGGDGADTGGIESSAEVQTNGKEEEFDEVTSMGVRSQRLETSDSDEAGKSENTTAVVSNEDDDERNETTNAVTSHENSDERSDDATT
jgi:hypothetical protein